MPLLLDGLTPGAAASPSHAATVCPGLHCNDTTVSPGVLGFGVFVALAVAVYFLIRSFRKHIARVPPTFDDPGDS